MGPGHILVAASSRVIVEVPGTQTLSPNGFLLPITLGLQQWVIYLLKTHNFAADMSHETLGQQRLPATQQP